MTGPVGSNHGSLHGTGNISVLDSGFFVIHVLVDENKNGVYGLDLIKNKW